MRNIYNGNTIIDSLTGATKVDYVVSLFLLRSAELSNEDFTFYTKTDYDGIITKTSVTAHSPLISGNFSFSIGGVEFTDLPYDISENSLEAKIRTIVGYEQVFVDRKSPNGPGISNTFIINYVGVNNAIPNVTVNGALLSGGTTSPTI